MINWYYFLVASVALLAYLFWKEWKRKNKARLFLRILVSSIAVASLLFLAYPRNEDETKTAAGKVAILTDGYVPDILTKFLQANNKEIPAYSTDLSIIHASQNNVHLIPELSAFFTSHANDTLHVFGNGFTEDELDLLNNHSLILHDSYYLSATSSVYWKQQLKPGEPLTVQGEYENVSLNEVKLFLKAFDETVDSASIAAATQKDFSLTVIPKHTGKAVYSLIAVSGSDTLQNEPVPLNVQPALPLKILILSSSPDFEKTFLKNRLSQNGYEVTVSTTISKNKKDEQFLNMPQSSADKISSSYLDKFDVLIADDLLLSQLNSSASAAIRNAIEEKGMGLIVKMNSDRNNSSFYSRFFQTQPSKEDKKTFSLLHSSMNDSDRYKIKIDEPIYLRTQNGTQSLLQDEQSNTYAANTIFGKGRIVATTLNNTYTLALSGDNKSWQSLWSLLLDKAAKKITDDDSWRVSPQFSFVNKPSSLILETNANHLPQGQVGENKIYMKQDSSLPYQWQGTYWPENGGWQSLIESGGQIKNWYAYNQNDWQAMINFQKQKATKEYTAAHPIVLFPQQTAGQNDKWTSHLTLYLVILFFICCSALWIEQKLA